MHGKFSTGINLILILVLTSILPCRAYGIPSSVRRQIKDIRFWTAPDHTRVVLDMSSESSYSIKTFDNPPRIAIEIPYGKLARSVKPVEVHDGVIERIRINRLRSRIQIVLDLTRKTDYKDFALKPYKSRPHRIVIDVNRVFTTKQIKEEERKAEAIARSGDYIVIIDPGHGGSQPGAISRTGLKEKDVVLKLAKILRTEINSHEGFRAVLTRNGDYNVSLQRRIDIAKMHGGDCFISLHLNSHYNRKARGSEVYFLSLSGATDKNAQAVAEKENLLLEMGEARSDFNDDLKEIIFDLNRSNTMYRSSLLAAEIARAMKSEQIIPFRGVKQANFVVLRSIALPSVLVEVAFLSNRKDEHMIRKTSTLRGIAKLISKGIISYLERNPPGEKLVRSERVAFHTVSKGETLWAIARKYKMNLKDLLELNSLKRSSRIRPGQRLKVLLH